MPSDEPRCDLHGPVTPQEAALMVLGHWTPVRTGYLCPTCQAAVTAMAQDLSDRIDAQALDAVLKEYGGGHA